MAHHELTAEQYADNATCVAVETLVRAGVERKAAAAGLTVEGIIVQWHRDRWGDGWLCRASAVVAG